MIRRLDQRAIPKHLKLMPAVAFSVIIDRRIPPAALDLMHVEPHAGRVRGLRERKIEMQPY